MPYDGFNYQHRRLLLLHWCNLNDFYNFIRKHEYMDFFDSKNRAVFIRDLKNLHVGNNYESGDEEEDETPWPFSIDHRFPDQEDIVNLDGPLRIWLDRLVKACINARHLDGSSRSDNSLMQFKKLFDIAMENTVKLAFSSTSSEELAKAGIYDQHSFELAFNLQWTAEINRRAPVVPSV